MARSHSAPSSLIFLWLPLPWPIASLRTWAMSAKGYPQIWVFIYFYDWELRTINDNFTPPLKWLKHTETGHLWGVPYFSTDPHWNSTAGFAATLFGAGCKRGAAIPGGLRFERSDNARCPGVRKWPEGIPLFFEICWRLNQQQLGYGIYTWNFMKTDEMSMPSQSDFPKAWSVQGCAFGAVHSWLILIAYHCIPHSRCIMWTVLNLDLTFWGGTTVYRPINISNQK